MLNKVKFSILLGNFIASEVIKLDCKSFKFLTTLQTNLIVFVTLDQSLDSLASSKSKTILVKNSIVFFNKNH